MTVSAFPWGQVAILSASVEGAQRRFTQPDAREGRAYTVKEVTSLPVLNSSFIEENALARSVETAVPPEVEAVLDCVGCAGWEVGL